MMALKRASSNLVLAGAFLVLAAAPAAASDGTEAKRTLNADGSTSMTFSGDLSDLNTKIGLDVSAAAVTAAPVPGGQSAALDGTAFANMSLKQLPVWMLWEKNTVDVRLDPGTDTSKLATTFERSWTLAPQFSASLSDSYAVQRAEAVGSWQTDKAISLKMEETGTTFSIAAKAEDGLVKWQPSVSASQRIAKDFAITTTVADTGSAITRSITAGYSYRW